MKRSPFALLCALLLVTLRQRPADPALAAALARPGIDWPRLVTLSGVHLLTPALAPALGDPALRPHVPEDLLFYLDAMLTAATERNLALRHQLEEVAACLNAVEVIPVVLKGGARLIDDLWPDPSLRFMHDLDLLVRRRRPQGAGSLPRGQAGEPRHRPRRQPCLSRPQRLGPRPRAGGLPEDPLHGDPRAPLSRPWAGSRPGGRSGGRVPPDLRLPSGSDLAHRLSDVRFL